MNVYECTLVIADGIAETQAVGAAIELQVERIIGTQAATSGGVSDGDKGDITVSASGTAWTIDNGVVSTAKLADRSVTAAKLFEVGHQKLIGRHGAGAGDAQEIGIDGGLEFHGGNIRRAALTGDVTASAGSNVLTITPASNPSWVVDLAWSKLTGVPSTFAPSAHTHPLSELTQSGATTGQVAQWNGTAWVPATSSGGGSTNLWFPAAQWIPRTTNGCGVDSIELSTNKINLDELLFDAASIEYAQLATVMPTNWDLGTITAKFHWRAASGSGDVVWALSARSYANDDALDQATGTAQSVTDTLTAANDLCVSPATPAITVTGTAASGNLVLFEVSRTATAGGDTLAVDARLVGVEISYTSI